MTQQTVAPDTGFQTVTNFTYASPDTNNWLVAEVSAVTVTDTVPSQPVLSRTGSFAYQANTGLLASSVVEPNLTATTPAGQVEQLQLTTQYGYDGFGNPITIGLQPSDLAARTTTLSWATPSSNLNNGPQFNQFLQGATDALGHIANFGYDARFGTVIVAKDINNLPTSGSNDTFGRSTLAIGPDGTGDKTTYTYCPSVPGGTAACVTNGAYQIAAALVDSAGHTIGPAVTSTFDIFGRVLTTDTTAFDGVSASRVQTTYNALGEIINVTQPLLVGSGTPTATQFQYDALGRVTQTTAPDGSTVGHAYDALRQTDTLPTEPGPFGGTEIIRTVRNALGETVSVTDPIGNPTQYTYFAFGNLASVTDAAGNVVSYSYDPLGRRTGVVDPDAGARSGSYFSTGELATTTVPGATTGAAPLTASYAYDQLGRVTSRSEPDLNSTWVYDQNGNLGKLTTASTAAGDAAGYPGGCTYGYTYDSLKRLSGTTLVFGTGTSTVFGFGDAYVPVGQPGAGRLASVTDNNSGSVTSYAYTALGYFRQLSRGTAAAPAANPVYSIASADASLRPLKVTYGTASFTNSLVSGSSTSLTDAYSYDQLNQLITASNAATSKTFGYDDKTGNITSKSDTGTYTYPTAGQPGPHQLSDSHFDFLHCNLRFSWA